MSNLGDKFVQRIDEVAIYFTYYALFEEPDEDIPQAIYIDAATGMPTNEMVLNPPVNQRSFTRTQPNPTVYQAPAETSGPLPYFVEPPGFPPLPAPPEVIAAIEGVTHLPQAVIVPNTKPLLVAIGQFLPTGEVKGRVTGVNFEVEKVVQFEVRIRTGFIFTPPQGIAAPSVAILVGYLTMGLLHQLIQLPPPPNPNEVVLYNWRAPMKLSTSGEYVRKVAEEPVPVANPFEAGLT